MASFDVGRSVGLYPRRVFSQSGKNRITEFTRYPVFFHQPDARLAVLAAHHHAARAPHVVFGKTYPELPVFFFGDCNA
jgi:hypothetical protein